MLPRKFHLEQINRFHNAYIDLDKQIESETDKDKQLELLRKNMQIIRFWSEIDDFIEYKLKQKLDELDLP